MEKSILINIGFNLSEPLHGTILKISQEIRDTYESEWYLDDKKYHLHFPMYLIPIPIENKTLIQETAEKYLKECKKLQVEIKSLFYNNNGLLMIKFGLTDKLFQMHKFSLKYFNPLRQDLQRDKYLNPDYINKLSNTDKAYIRKYGSEYVLDNYVPHITIARVEDVQNRKLIQNIYRNSLVDSNGVLDRLQVHTPIFSKDRDKDRTVLLFDEGIGE